MIGSKISIVDYGAGNLGSVLKLFYELGRECEIVTTPEQIRGAALVVLPGQGAIGAALTHLKATGMYGAILDYIMQDRPLLGICLGMQLLMDFSEEDGGCEGFGIFRGRVLKFSKELGVKVPHMGWNQLEILQDQQGYTEGLDTPLYAYFAHSYYIQDLASDYIVSETTHGVTFASVIAKNKLMGIQSHPEKSGEMGLKLINNYLNKWRL